MSVYGCQGTTTFGNKYICRHNFSRQIFKVQNMFFFFLLTDLKNIEGRESNGDFIYSYIALYITGIYVYGYFGIYV